MKRIINGLPLKATYSLLDQEDRREFFDFLCAWKTRTISGFALSADTTPKVTVVDWHESNLRGGYHELDNDKPLGEQIDYLHFKNGSSTIFVNFRNPISKSSKVSFSRTDGSVIVNKDSVSFTKTAKEAAELAEYLNSGIFEGKELEKFFTEFTVTIDHDFVAIDSDKIIIETNPNFGEGTYIIYNASCSTAAFQIARTDPFGVQSPEVTEITLNPKEYIRHDLKNNDEISFYDDYRSILIGKVL